MLGDDTLDRATAALVALAAALATGDERRMEACARTAFEVPVPPLWADELLLQSVLMLGYPRALVGAAVWRAATAIRGPAADASLLETVELWRSRGEETCRRIYGPNYDRLRENVRRLHPALDAWMVLEGYGRVLSRPGLDLARRELCTVAQIAVLRSPRQLHSHLRGALNAGATAAQVGAAISIAAAVAGDEVVADARAMWQRMTHDS